MKEDKLIKRMQENSNAVFSMNPPIPKKNFLVEVTNACNSACIFCANRKMTRKIGNIDKTLLDKILNDAYNEGVREVGFYTTGEPLVCNNLNDYIGLAKKIGFQYIYITTNGVLANIARVKDLVENGLDSIKFSINAIDEKTYKLIHGKDDFQKVMKNLKDLSEYRKTSEKKFKIYVSYIATRYSIGDSSLIKAKFENLCDEVILLNTINQSGLTPEVDTLLKVQDKQTDIDYKITLPCNMPFNTINVTCEGYVTACCADFQNYLVYADLNEMSLAEAWNNKVIGALRRMHLDGDVRDTLCKNCVYNTKDKPEPLIKELATGFDVNMMFDDQIVIDRITEYKKTEGE